MKGIFTRLFVLVGFIFIAECSWAQFLKADGTRIVDANGDEVIWRGIGLGGWMLQEGYMLRTSGAQHEIEERIEALVGEEKMDQFYEAWLANHTRKIDVDSMASWGYNMIRLPMHYKLFTPPIEDEPVQGEISWNEKGFAMVDTLVEWCRANEIYLILDLHATPGGQGENADISDYDPDKPSLWESELNQAKMVALWRKLAERYADETVIAAYDIINEPNWGFQNHANDPNGCAESNNAPLWDLQKRVTAAIREVDQNHIVVIEGNCWGNNYAGLPALWDDNLVISYHKYWNGNAQSDIQGMLNMRSNRNVPIWLGETGENSNTWFTDCIDLLETNGIGWSWWPLKKLGNNNPLQIPMNQNYQKVIDYWGGNGSKPSVDVAFEGLMQFAEDLKLENNIFHKDVVDAKIRQPHSLQTKPFYHRNIKSEGWNIIPASDFDLGRHGFAYADKEVTNITGNAGGQAWNLGYAYRNDGVDIQETSDESAYSNGYNVGWTEDGEWMQYTAEVDSSGTYTLLIRYAGEGKMHLEANGVNISGILALPASGGYQVWKDFKVEHVSLTEGTNQLKLVIDQGGFNLGYFGFFLTGDLTQAPFLAQSASIVSGAEVTISLNKTIDAESISSDDFTASIDGAAVSITSISAEENVLILTLDAAPYDGQEILISYSGNALTAEDGTVLTTFENLSVFNFLPEHVRVPGLIQAEAFNTSRGIQLETTEDTGGGQNVGYTDAGDYMEYLVNVSKEGRYELVVRIAAESSAGKIAIDQLDKDGNILQQKELTLPVTGGWQTWTNASVELPLTEGRSVLRVRVVKSGFNFNWMRLSYLGTITAVTEMSQWQVFPNPATDRLTLVSASAQKANSTVKIRNLAGQLVYEKALSERFQLDVSDWKSGIYVIEFYQDNKIIERQKLQVLH